MIYDTDDIIEEMYEKYPQIKKSSIRKICKKGLAEIKKHAMRRRDVELKTNAGHVIFFFPQTPEKQRRRVAIKMVKDKFVHEKANSKRV